MGYKLNKAGKLQAYDSKGRYTSNGSKIERQKPTNYEKRMKKLKQLEEKILLKGDPLVIDVFRELTKWNYKLITDAHRIIKKPDHNTFTELDLETSKLIIEVKSGSSMGNLQQFLKQKQYADLAKKKYIVYGPLFSKRSIEGYNKEEIVILKNMGELIKYIKENK